MTGNLPAHGPRPRGHATSALSLRAGEVVVLVGPPVAVELPGLADLRDEVEVHVPDDQLLLVRAPDPADELATRVHEVALPVEIVLAERLPADPVDRPDEVAVGQRMAHLLDPPQVLRKAAAGRGRDEHHLRAVQPQRSRALRKM